MFFSCQYTQLTFMYAFMPILQQCLENLAFIQQKKKKSTCSCRLYLCFFIVFRVKHTELFMHLLYLFWIFYCTINVNLIMLKLTVDLAFVVLLYEIWHNVMSFLVSINKINLYSCVYSIFNFYLENAVFYTVNVIR